MPATALRHPETDEELVLPAVSSSRPLSPPHSSSPHSATTNDSLDWRTVAPYVDRFSGTAVAAEQFAARRRLRQHRRFVLSGPFLASTVVFLELMALVWVYALDLRTLRQEDALKKQIQQTSLQIALNQNKLASYKSSPLLSQWAAGLGYRPIEATDFDDVTSNAPLPPPPRPAQKETP